MYGQHFTDLRAMVCTNMFFYLMTMVISQRHVVSVPLLRSHFRLSVCPSVTHVSSEWVNTLILLANLFTPLDRLRCEKSTRKYCYVEGSMRRSRFSTSISLYLQNDTRYRHNYNGRRIGSRMRSIEWCHFQWSWTTCNTFFTGTPLFDAEYVIY